MSHFLFADDSVIFCKATLEQALVIRDILTRYERASGQNGNFNKTNVMFSKGIPRAQREDITGCLSIKEVLAHDKYLGL